MQRIKRKFSLSSLCCVIFFVILSAALYALKLEFARYTSLPSCQISTYSWANHPDRASHYAGSSANTIRYDPVFDMWRRTTKAAAFNASSSLAQLPVDTVSTDPNYAGPLATLSPLQRILSEHTVLRAEREQVSMRVLLEYDGAESQLRAYGFSPTSRSGSIFAGWLPIQNIKDISQLPHLRSISTSRKLYPHLNVSTPMVFAPQTHIQYGLDGRDVIIGIIDTGIDYRHPAFLNANGTTRIISILDFSLPDPITGQAPRLFTNDQINAALKNSSPLGHEDNTGHGTHIAGIAAGNQLSEKDSGSRYRGVAPRANLVVVKGIRDNRREFDSGDVLQGISYIHDLARRYRSPYVINLSLGGQHGGHDGNTLLERAIANFSGPGKYGQSIVASAGNEGQQQIHASGWLQRPHSLTLRLQVPEYKEADKLPPTSAQVLLEIWSHIDGDMGFAIRTPRGHYIPRFQRSNVPDKPIQTPDGVVIFSHSTHTNPPAGHQLGILLSHDTNTPLYPGVWRIEFYGQTPRFDAWVAETRLPYGSVRWLDYRAQELLIGVPASTDAVITVGAFNSRSGWLNGLGHVIQREIISGDLANFSSPGPTRDARPKPEIVAPGIFVAAPASAFSNPSPNSLVADGPYIVSQGTSQAAPHVTGGIALMLQLKRNLDTPAIRNVIIRSASTDSFTADGATYQAQWGFGKLNLLKALQTLTQVSSGSPDPTRSTLGSVFRRLPADGRSQTPIFLIPKDVAGTPLASPRSVQIHTTAGTLSPTVEDSNGVYRANLTAPRSPQMAYISAIVDGISVTTQLQIDFLSAHAPQSVGCQCSALSSGGSFSLIFLLFMLWPLFFCYRQYSR